MNTDITKQENELCTIQNVVRSYSQEDLMTFITKLRKTQYQINDLEHKCLDFDFKLEAEAKAKEAELISKIINEMKTDFDLGSIHELETPY